MDVFIKESLENGKPARIECLEIDGQVYTVSRGLATVLRLEDEWYEDVHHPESVIAALKRSRPRIDLFTFWQRLPDIQPRFAFHREWDTLAALPVQSFDHWWAHQIKDKTRNLVRKAKKHGVEAREASYDDAFVRGMTEIFNETPIRQGRPFWHYGKDFQTVRRQFARYLFREDLIGAYLRGELIGFVMLGNAGRYGILGQFISKIAHRDKSPNNALIAKTVEICEKRGFAHLVYGHWDSGSLTGFKDHCGFRPTLAPRYYVPLSAWGRVILRLGVYRGWKGLLPQRVTEQLKIARRAWHLRRERAIRAGNRGTD
jgi:hypothetical protein